MTVRRHWLLKYIIFTEKFSTGDFFNIILFWISYFISIELPQNITPYDKTEWTKAKQTKFIRTIFMSDRPQICQTRFKDNSKLNLYF